MESQEKTVIWITQYLAGKASDEEVALLREWVETSSENQKLYLQVKNIWEVSSNEVKITDKKTEIALNEVMKKLKVNKYTTHGFLWQRIASIILIPLIIGSFLLGRLHFSNNGDVRVVYNVAYASNGIRSLFTLADGSVVYLNAGSSIRYPDKFVDGRRVVYLKGEAYFEVESDPKKPFIVQTAGVSVRATGTKFCVNAYPQNEKVEVTLVKGTVYVSKGDENIKSTLITVMKPSQHLKYDTTTGESHIDTEDTYKYIAWKDGKIIFRNDPLSEVVKKLSQVYDVDFEIEGDDLANYRYHATFKDESLNEILNLLRISAPIDYKEYKRTILSDGSFSKRKVLIYAKRK